MHKKIIPVLFSIALISLSGVPLQSAYATSTSGEIFYTQFSNSPNVSRVTYTFDGVTFTLGPPVGIGTTNGADGIVGNPQNSDKLIIGGQNTLQIHNIQKSDSFIQSFATPATVFHLEVTSPTNVLGSDIPGALVRHPIAPVTGDLGAGTLITPAGGPDSVITQVISGAPGNLFFYTSSGGQGNGNYGAITFNTGNPDTATTYTTTQFHGPVGSVNNAVLPAAHGGVLDPFTGDVILFGNNRMTQLDLAGNIVPNGDRNFNGVCSSTDPNNPINPVPVFPNFDQGTVDGNGHAIVASNGGHLFFIDYSVSGNIAAASNFVACLFLGTNLDDVAPLVGMGSTGDGPIGGTILSINTISLLIAGVQSNVFSLFGALALVGGVAIGAIYLTSKRKN